MQLDVVHQRRAGELRPGSSVSTIAGPETRRTITARSSRPRRASTSSTQRPTRSRLSAMDGHPAGNPGRTATAPAGASGSTPQSPRTALSSSLATPSSVVGVSRSVAMTSIGGFGAPWRRTRRPPPTRVLHPSTPRSSRPVSRARPAAPSSGHSRPTGGGRCPDPGTEECRGQAQRPDVRRPVAQQRLRPLHRQQEGTIDVRVGSPQGGHRGGLPWPAHRPARQASARSRSRISAVLAPGADRLFRERPAHDALAIDQHVGAVGEEAILQQHTVPPAHLPLEIAQQLDGDALLRLELLQRRAPSPR